MRLPRPAPSRRRPPRAIAALLPALGLLATAPAALAADYQWLGQVDTLWFSNPTSVGGVIRHNWTPAGPPASFLYPSVFIDNDPSRSSKVQLSPGSPVGPTPGCTGSIVCGSWGATLGHLAIDSGDTLVIGGSGALGDSFQYANGGARIELKNPGLPVTVVNNGLLRLSAGSGRYALIGIDGVATLSGSGETVLDNGHASTDLRAGDNGSHNARQIVYGMNGYSDRLVVAAGHTLRGRGLIGHNGSLQIDNAGLIRAEAAGLLTLQGINGVVPPRTHAIVNTGLLQAVGGATLALNGSVDNTGGVIEAGDGAFVHLGAGTTGGLLRSTGSGVIRSVSTAIGHPLLDGGVVLQGHLQVVAGSRLGLGGTVTNNGLIDIGTTVAGVGAANGVTDLRVFSDSLIDGTGRIVLNDRQAARNTITGYANVIGRTPVLTLGAGQSVSGAGILGGSSTSARTLDVVNQGTILADGADGMVFAAANSFRNDGVVRVSTSLTVAGANLANHQQLEVLAGAALYGSATQAAGHMRIDGTADTVRLTGGLLDGLGSIGTLTQTGGTFAPGHSPGAMQIDGNYRLGGGELVLEIDGDGPGESDSLTVGGSFTAGGGTVLIDLRGYLGSGSLGLTGLLRADVLLGTPTVSVLGGPAGRVQAVWNGNALDVHISAVPEPGPAALLAAGLLALGLLRRRRAPRG